MIQIQIERIGVEALIPYARNSRTHSDAQVAQIAASIREFGFTNPVLVDEVNGIIAGHGRVLAARKLQMQNVPAIRLSHLTEAQKRAYVIADNKLALNAGWDEELLRLEINDLRGLDFDLALTGFSTEELDALLTARSGNEETSKNSLAGRFLVPPFSVLNAREGWWQDRKREWISLGIKSEEGRDAVAYVGQDGLNKIRSSAPGGSNMVSNYKNGKRETGLVAENGTSIFDPVLCEIVVRWFSPVDGLILDPFAGGSVRGIVAAKLGRKYIGHELRPEQVAANRKQAAEICLDEDPHPAWIEGDSRNIDKTCNDVQADLIFSCPPYADLEVYSDDPADLSTLKYDDFRKAYTEIVSKSCQRLKSNRFACFVVGEVRNKKGNYYDFVGDTVDAFRSAGLEYYNEAILVTAVGSLPIRAGKQFSASRKLGKTHQNVLIFVKGDARQAVRDLGDVEIDEAALENSSSDDE